MICPFCKGASHMALVEEYAGPNEHYCQEGQLRTRYHQCSTCRRQFIDTPQGVYRRALCG